MTSSARLAPSSMEKAASSLQLRMKEEMRVLPQLHVLACQASVLFELEGREAGQEEKEGGTVTMSRYINRIVKL